MKLKIRSFKGFTIVEILISLIVSSILILIASQIMSGFNKVLITNNADWVNNNDILEIISVLGMDLENCDIALKTESDEITLHGNDNIRYLFHQETLIRCCINSIDSLHLSYTNMELETINTSKIVIRICFDIIHKGNLYPVELAKEYGEAEIYNYQILLDEYRYQGSYQ